MLLSCAYAKWFIQSNKTQLFESPHSVVCLCCLFSFKFSRYMCTYVRNHLNFQNAFVLDKYQHDFLFLYSLWRSQKKYPWKHMRLMYGFGRKEHQRILHVVVLWAKLRSKCYLHVITTKKSVMWTQENTWSYFTREAQ